MKKILLTLLLIFLFNCFTAKAQTDPSAPTQQDAIDFLNKAAKECGCFGSTVTYGTIKGMTYSLQGCMLIIVMDYEQDAANGYNGDYNEIEIQEKINLSLVYLKHESLYFTAKNGVSYPDGASIINIISNNKGDIYNHYYCQDYKSNGKKRTDPNIYEKIPNDYSFLETFDQNGLCGKSSIFESQHYADRIFKALDFLVISCGGGKIKVDATEKF
jgi:hypothetical protein